MRNFCFFLVLCSSITLLAVPAYNRRVKVCVVDGYVYITLHGDENCKYGIAANGYTVLQNGDAWYYACIDSVGNVGCSKFMLRQESDSLTNEFLQKTSKGLKPHLVGESFSNNRVISHRNVGYDPIKGERKVLVILMQFPDLKFHYGAADFENLFNHPNYTFDGAAGSVYDYYKEVSYGQLELRSDILGPYTTVGNVASYGSNAGVGGNDRNPMGLFREALEYARMEVDLADYDCDADGYVDNIHIIFAGYGEEAGAKSSAIWSHEMTFAPIDVQGVFIDRYSCSPELRGNSGTGISRIGVACHEIGHALGAMDYYDTNYQVGGQFYGTGEWDVMAEGSWNNTGISPADFNPYVKAYNFGWVNVKELPEGESTIGPSYIKDEIYRIDTPVSNEFFLLENRRKTDFNSHIPGEGLIIYHINSDIEAKARNNTINTGYPQSCYPVCASSSFPVPTSLSSSYGKVNSSGCPYPGSSNNTEFSSSSIPASHCYNGNQSGVDIVEIHELCENIILTRNSSTSGDSEYDEAFWEESFENNTLDSFWHCQDVLGKALWSIRKVLSGSLNQVVAVDGKGYLKFYSDASSPTISNKLISRLISERVRLSAGGLFDITLYCRKDCKSSVSNDSIRLLFSSDNNEWEEVLVAAIPTNNDWNYYTTEFRTETGDAWFIIEGNINARSTMYLDAISVHKRESEETSVDEQLVDKDSLLSIDVKGCTITMCNRSEVVETVRIFDSKGEMRYLIKLGKGTVREFSCGSGIYFIKSKYKTEKVLLDAINY